MFCTVFHLLCSLEENLLKNTRQAAILQIISQYEVETQEELSGYLSNVGIRATQATISRDIKDMHLVKTQSGNGKYRYSAAQRAENALADRFVRIFRDSVLNIASAGNIIVIKTLSGSANAACEAIDSMQIEDILGTMAGDNTIFIVVHTADAAESVAEQFRQMLR